MKERTKQPANYLNEEEVNEGKVLQLINQPMKKEINKN